MRKTLTYLVVWEIGWWLRRRVKRGQVYNAALARARAESLPLVVVGTPDAGITGGYGCGDVTVDIQNSTCPRHIRANITKTLPLADNSAVVFVSCVLEYVDDLNAAMKELWRVSGGRLYIVRVEPWTLTAYLYPGAKRTISVGQAGFGEMIDELCPTMYEPVLGADGSTYRNSCSALRYAGVPCVRLKRARSTD